VLANTAAIREISQTQHAHSFTGAEFTVVKGEVWRKTRAWSLNNYYIVDALISIALSAINYTYL